MSVVPNRGSAFFAFRVVAAVIAAAVVTIAGTALAFSSAGSGPLAKHDAASDMQRVTSVTDNITGKTHTSTRRLAPRHRDGDITGYQVTYAGRTMTALVRFRELSPGSTVTRSGTTITDYRKIAVDFAAPNGKVFMVAATRNSGGRLSVEGNDGTIHPCTGTTGNYSPTRHLLTIQVPAKCLRMPHRIRASIASVDERITQNDSTFATVDYVDSAIGRYRLLDSSFTGWITHK